MIPAVDLARAVDIIRAGGVVAFPTETYYGLAVDPFNRRALARLFRIKKRLADKPILTVINDVSQLSLLAREIPPPFLPLMNRFWPGPLTLIFGALENLPTALTGNTGTVGVRFSSHPMAQALVRAYDGPVTATSANISGVDAAINALGVRQQFGGGIDYILDGGETAGRQGSTIIAFDNKKTRLIRAGAVPFELISEYIEILT